MEEPRYDFVKFVIRQDGMPIILPQREDLVSLCVILNELAWPNMAGDLPDHIKKCHLSNKSALFGSEDDAHKVDIKPSVTTMQRINISKEGKVDIRSEFHLDTKEIIKIINKWDSMLCA